MIRWRKYESMACLAYGNAYRKLVYHVGGRDSKVMSPYLFSWRCLKFVVSKMMSQKDSKDIPQYS